MDKKRCLESFNADIDKILSGESTNPSEYQQCNEEYKELLLLAQLLARADFSAEIEGRKEKIWANIQRSDELDDEDLDLVAGGVNLNEMSDDKGKIKGK